jgi:hypothetical protein
MICFEPRLRTSNLLLLLHSNIICALAICSKQLPKIADELIRWRFFAGQYRAPGN